MKLARNMPQFRSIKLAPFALISVFLFTNLTGIFFGHVLAPTASANSLTSGIPQDIPTSGDEKLDGIIFHAGKRKGIDPRFIHPAIWQDAKYIANARSQTGDSGLMQ